MMLCEGNHDRLGPKGVQLLTAGETMSHVLPPFAAGSATELAIGRGETAADRSEAGMPLADDVKEGRPDQVFSPRFEDGHMSGRIQTMPLVIARLGKICFGFGHREPSADFLDLIRAQTRREQDRQESNGEMTPGPGGRDRRWAQERFTVQSTQ